MRMLSLEELRKVEPNFAEVDDKSLIKFRAKLYELADLALDACMKERTTGGRDIDNLGECDSLQ